MTSIVADPPALQARTAGLKYVYRLDEPEAADPAITGGKASSAARLLRGGIPVPAAFAISRRLCDELFVDHNLIPFFSELYATLDPHNRALVAARSLRMMDAVKGAQIREEALVEIDAAHAAIFGEDGEAAYRSTNTDEDGADAAYAGQFDTELFVNRPRAKKAIKSVIASLHGARVVEYRAERDMDHVHAAMPILVMQMVRSKVAGVMLTANKVTGNTNEIYIEVVAAQGESAVDGSTTPDVVILDKQTGKVISYRFAKKQKWMNDRGVDNQGNSVLVRTLVPKAIRRKRKLTEDHLQMLWHWALKIEELGEGKPRDTEFAFAEASEADIARNLGNIVGDDAYWCLQDRPITKMGEKATDVKATKPKIVEGIPGSPGAVSGVAQVIKRMSDLHLFKEGGILVMPETDIEAEPQMAMSIGIVTDTGGGASHAALTAAELGVPCAVGTRNATKVMKSGRTYTLDGTSGIVLDGEDLAIILAYNEERQRNDAKARSLMTLVEIAVNIGNPKLADEIAKLYADAVGLGRAEFILTNFIKIHPEWFIKHGTEDNFISMLVNAFAIICAAFGRRSVLARMLDPRVDEFKGLELGSEYLPYNPNPAIGSHGAGMAIINREVFEMEMRAYVELAKRYPNFGFMSAFHRFPYEAEEIAYIAAKLGLDFKNPNFTAAMMWETAANGIDPDAFLKPAARVGYTYISIGGNDATQGVLEVDRGLSMIQGMYSQAHPTMLKFHGDAIAAGHRYGMKVGFCGDGINKEPKLFRHLIRSGIDSVSPSPGMVNKLRIQAAELEAEMLGVDLEEYQARFPELSRKLAEQLGKKYPSRLVAATH